MLQNNLVLQQAAEALAKVATPVILETPAVRRAKTPKTANGFICDYWRSVIIDVNCSDNVLDSVPAQLILETPTSKTLKSTKKKYMTDFLCLAKAMYYRRTPSSSGKKSRKSNLSALEAAAEGRDLSGSDSFVDSLMPEVRFRLLGVVSRVMAPLGVRYRCDVRTFARVERRGVYRRSSNTGIRCC